MNMTPEQRQRNKRINQGIQRSLAIMLPVVLVVFIGWVSDYIKGDLMFVWLIGQDVYLKFFIMLMLLGSAVVMSIWLYENRRVYLPIRSLSRQRSNPKACLIILVSDPRPKTEFNPNSVFPIKITNNFSQATFHVVAENALQRTIEQLDKSGIRWNWEQLLRGVFAHRKAPLKHIYLIGSEGKTGSHQYLTQCQTMLQHYQASATISICPNAVDFEDLDELTHTLHKAIQHFNGLGYHEGDICIDATGGQKTTSISAALVTLTSKVTFQYVQTGAAKEVISYDVISATDPNIGT